MLKDCTKCGQCLPLEGFSPNPRGRQGRHSTCYECTRLRNSENYHRDPAGRKAFPAFYRTPAWADRAAITDFYRNRPEGMVVDHIIPRNGKTVSGLHVLANLQYLTPAENAAKGNHLP